MLVSFSAENFMAFSTGKSLCMRPDKDIRTKDAGVFHLDSVSILKSCCIYGPNNSGKSCLIHAMECIRDLILNHVNERYMHPSKGTDCSVIRFKVEICNEQQEAYEYCVKYDTESKSFVHESLIEIDESIEERYDSRREKEIFIRDLEKDICRSKDGGEEVLELMKAAPSGQLLIHSLRDHLDVYTDALEDFARSVDIVDMNTITLEKTTRALKYGTPLKERILQIIRQAQLYINDYAYVPEEGDDCCAVRSALQEVTPEDYGRLYSYYDGIAYRSIECDSAGTLKAVALAGYIADAYDNGRILFIDDLDGLYFRLAQAMVGLFSSDGNECLSQLVFTTHNFTILDFKDLFRRDQIMFMDRYYGCILWMKTGGMGEAIRSMTNTMKKIEEYNYTAPACPGFYDFVGNVPDD
ncbi:MAG: ATP-binding protein [Clostridia bacterium]|nr:ATP-binding protein [Clostridia bacterium]